MKCNQIAVLFVLPIVLLAGCRKPGAEPKTEAAAYDPAQDPLVNPPVMFEPPPADRAQIEEDETLFYQLDGSPNTLNPFFVSSGYEFEVVDKIFTIPFKFDKNFTWSTNEEVVETFQESEDHTEFVIRFKSGLQWQDGHPFSAHDVVYSWQQILDPQVPCETQKASTEPIKQCVALDDLTVKYVQPEALATSRLNLVFPIIPKHLFEKEKQNHPDLKTGNYYNQMARRPVGNGPYKVVEWKDQDKIVLERWEEYTGKKPYFKRIVYRIIPDRNVALLSFEKQDVDIIEQLTSQQFALETNTETFRSAGYKAWGVQWSYNYIGWNMDGSNPFFTDKRVRCAMTHAFDTPLILKKIMYGLGTVSNGIFHPACWAHNPAVKPLEYNLTLSAQLLDEAGWKVNPQDGWRYKTIDGKEVKFEFTLTHAQGSDTAAKVAAIFQEDLKKIGVDMKTRTLEWATFLEKVHKHEFEAETARWTTGADPDLDWNLWRTEEYKTGRNFGGYSNPKVDELFVRGRKEFDFAKRKKIYQEIHKLIFEDQPYIWINNVPILSAINKRIRGIEFTPRGIEGTYPGLYAWWVPKGQGKHVVLNIP